MKCGKEKKLNKFYTSASGVLGVTNKCKKCERDYSRSASGVIRLIYSNQKITSKKRGHTPPQYSQQQLKDWLLDNEKFTYIYNHWVYSNYEQDLKPSIDRLDIIKGYSFDNIQVLTWAENRDKGKIERSESINKHEDKIRSLMRGE